MACVCILFLSWIHTIISRIAFTFIYCWNLFGMIPSFPSLPVTSLLLHFGSQLVFAASRHIVKLLHFDSHPFNHLYACVCARFHCSNDGATATMVSICNTPSFLAIKWMMCGELKSINLINRNVLVMSVIMWWSCAPAFEIGRFGGCSAFGH